MGDIVMCDQNSDLAAVTQMLYVLTITWMWIVEYVYLKAIQMLSKCWVTLLVLPDGW